MMKELKAWEEMRAGRNVPPEETKQYKDTQLAVEFGDLLRELRLQAGMSQVELARKMGTTQSNIARLEAGTRTPTFETLQKVAEAVHGSLIVGIVGMGSSNGNGEERRAIEGPIEALRTRGKVVVR